MIRWRRLNLVLGATLLPLLALPAADLPRQTNSLGMIFISLSGGEFLMGSPDREAEAMAAWMRTNKITDWYPKSPPSEVPQRRVRLARGFAICAHETRLGDFRSFAAATGYQTDAEKDGKGADGKLPDGKWADAKPQFNWRNMGYERADDEPVVNVSWNDAVAFCEWLSKKEGLTYRLPTEAEWEYACRAGTTGSIFWGEESKRDDYVWSGANSTNHPHSVMQLKPNAWGLYDMNGNAYEYCADWWTTNIVRDVIGAVANVPVDTGVDSPVALLVDPRGPRQPDGQGWIVLRSGSWGTNPKHCRSAFRGGADKTHRNRRDGFRIVRD